MKTSKGSAAHSENQQAELVKAVEFAASSGDIVAVADVSLRLLHELKTAAEPDAIYSLLAALFKNKQRSTVAIFLQVFAAADGLKSPEAVGSLRSLRVDPASLLNYLNPEQLVELGLVDSSLARKRYQRLIGLETRTLTYDLSRDCPYGYAELMVLLSRATSLDDELWRRVVELMGLYSLEPFRVLCVVIDVLVIEEQGVNSEGLNWLAKSHWRGHSDLPAVLDMFLGDPLGVQLAARLTVLGAVSFTAMFAYFDPKYQGFIEYQRQIKQEHEAATQSGANALAMSELLDDDDDDDDEEGDLMMREDRLQSEELEANETGTDTRPSEEPSEAGHAEMMETALLYLGEIFAFTGPEQSADAAEDALKYVNAFPLVAGSSDAITRGLSKMACHFLDVGSLTRERILFVSTKYLTHISHNLSDEVWSVLNKTASENFAESPDFWTDFFRHFMLPSLDFKSTTGSVLWIFDEQRRFELYNDLQNRVAKDNFFVRTRFAKAEKETKNILKRLTKNDAEEKIVPALLEIFGQCPLPSLAAFVNQVESYNIGSLVARSTSTQIPALAMDMLPLIIMQQLTTSGRLAQQEDGLYESRWFRLLASFAGEIASQHAEFDFLSLIVLVLRQIGEGDYSQIIVLEQLLLRLSGIPLTTNVSIPQVLALSSAPVVREITEAALTEQIHPSRERLVELLQERNILLEVFVALCHVYNHMLLEGTNAKVVVNRRDLVSELILIYAELIGDSHKFDVIELCAQYGVPSPFALTLWRVSTKEMTVPDTAQKIPGFEKWAGKISVDLYFNFWHMSTFDIVFDEKLYTAVSEMRDAKIIEKSSLSHKLRTKSVKQKLISAKNSWFSAPSGEWNADALVGSLFIPRLLISPVDAVYVSRFLQLLHELEPSGYNFIDVGDVLFSRGTILALLSTASPLELESFATFVTDLFERFLNEKDFVQYIAGWSSALTATLLEVAVPTQSYIGLSNVFSFLQKAGFVFPIVSSDGDALLRRIHILTVSLTDGDLETSVKSLYAQLNKRKTLWIEPNDLEDLSDTDFFKAMILNHERLESRLLASLNAITSREVSDDKKSEVEAKRSRRRDNADRKDKRGGSKRSSNDTDLLSQIGKTETLSDSRKRFDDDRPFRTWGSRRDRGRRRR